VCGQCRARTSRRCLILSAGWFIVCLFGSSSSSLSCHLLAFCFLLAFKEVVVILNPSLLSDLNHTHTHTPAFVKCPASSSWLKENAFNFLLNCTNTHTHVYETHFIAIQQQILSSEFREQKINIEQNMLFVALSWAVTLLLLFHCADIAFCCFDMVFISCVGTKSFFIPVSV